MQDGRARHFRTARIALLLSILAIVLLYAWRDVTRRRERTTWERPLDVALVVLRKGTVAPDAAVTLRRRARDLEGVLAAEYARHRGEAGFRPFSFQVHGPIDVDESPPKPSGDGVVDLISYTIAAWRYFRDVDARGDVPGRGFDSRIYLVVRPPADAHRKFVEGQSEEGGTIGSVEVELDDSMVDFALFVGTHELFHTLGATDKYDASGRARVPDGLAEPARVPLYPQTHAEVMARNVVLGPGSERTPDSIEELRVGPTTAREIGWIR